MNRILKELPLPRDGADRRAKGPAPRTVTVNIAESPLGWLRARGLLSERQYAAGEQLRGDWERAGLSPAVTMRWDMAPQDKATLRGHTPGHASTRQIEARRRFRAAIDAAGTGLADLLWRTVCAGEGLGEVEQAQGWPARSSRVVLGIALDRLADHYRLN